MYPPAFEYHRAGSVEEAIRLLGELGDDAKLLAGGHSLLPLLKLRFARPAHLIDIRGVEGLAGIHEDEGALVIGATTTHRELETSALLHDKLPVLAEAAGEIGDPLVRNMGTVGGSLAHADPGADLPAVMLILEAEMIAVGPEGSRTIHAGDFFQGMFTSALGAEEVLTRIRIPLPGPGFGAAYEKFPHPASRYALAGAAAAVIMEDGLASDVRVALTGVGGIAARAPGVEEALTGREPTAEAVEGAAARAEEGLEPAEDLQGPADYKRNLARVCTQRALVRAVERAR